MAGLLREGGGGVKARPLRKKKLFIKILLPFKNKIYFTLVNVSLAILVQKLGEGKKCQNLFPAI